MRYEFNFLSDDLIGSNDLCNKMFFELYSDGAVFLIFMSHLEAYKILLCMIQRTRIYI